jgi:hypothetical protein
MAGLDPAIHAFMIPGRIEASPHHRAKLFEERLRFHSAYAR